MTANWETSYKTKINGQVVDLGDLFSKNDTAANPSVSISSALGGSNFKWNEQGINSDPTIPGAAAGIVAKNNTFHNGKIGGAHGHRPNGNYGFNDNQIKHNYINTIVNNEIKYHRDYLWNKEFSIYDTIINKLPCIYMIPQNYSVKPKLEPDACLLS